MTTTPLTTEDIAERVAAQRLKVGAGGHQEESGAGAVAAPPAPPLYKFYAPLVDAADGYVRWAKTPERRVYLGLPEFDAAMRGIAPGEMTLVVGYAHSGKTVVISEAILNNRTRRVAMFSPDETRELLLVKLTCLVHGVSAEHLERRIAAGDEDVARLVRDTAVEHFPRLAVFDESLTLAEMDTALTEAQRAWDDPPELVIFDYLDLLQGAGEEVQSKVRAIKAWGKRWNVPLIVLHQSSRTKGVDGQKVGISSGGFGGEQEAIHLLGVRRKKSQYLARIEELRERIATSSRVTEGMLEQLGDAEYELDRHQDTITVSLVKNKRPPGRLVDDIDYHLDADTGRITPMHERPTYTRAMAAVRARTAWKDEPFDEF